MEEKQSTCAPDVDATFVDGTAVVQMPSPGTAQTLQEYSDLVFLSCLQSTDISHEGRYSVGYIPDSTTLKKRQKGIRRRVAPSTQIPKNWKDFLHVDDNKTKLFTFLSQQAINLPSDERKEIYTINGRTVLTTTANILLTNPYPCLHEETDTCLLLHAVACSRCCQERAQKIM